MQYLQPCGFLHSFDVQFISAFSTTDRGHDSFKGASIYLGLNQELGDEGDVVRGI